MADVLQKKGQCVLITHYADLLKYICRKFFGWNGEKDKTGRSFLQYIGTDVIRKQDPDYWVNFLRDMLLFFEGSWDYVLIPDLRFPNELTKLREAGFDVLHLKIVRDSQESELTTSQQKHESETAMDGFVPDILLNNDGDISALRSKITELIEGGSL